MSGHDGIDRKAGGLLDGAPGFGFGPAGQPPAVRGADIALVADGRIARLYTLLLGD